MLAFAAEMFGDKSTEEVGWSSHSHQYAVIGENGQQISCQVLAVCLATMEGHQRAILGYMSVEEIYKDRQTFSTRSALSSSVLQMSYFLQGV